MVKYASVLGMPSAIVRPTGMPAADTAKRRPYSLEVTYQSVSSHPPGSRLKMPSRWSRP